MQNLQNKLNIVYIKDDQSFHENFNPKNIFNNKILSSLPIINNNSYFTESGSMNIRKNYLEGFKPKKDKRNRNKIESKVIGNHSRIKNLSFDLKKSNENILFLLKKLSFNKSNINQHINSINKGLFIDNNSSIKKNSKEITRYNITLNDNPKNKTVIKNQDMINFPKKLKTIIINDPYLTEPTTNKNKSLINFQKNIFEYNYNPNSKKINKKNKEENNKLTIHNTILKFDEDNIDNNINNFDLDLINNLINELSISYDSSLKELIKNKYIKKHHKRTLKSANLSKKYLIENKIKFELLDNNYTFENKNLHKLNKLLNRFNIINKENFDIKYLNFDILDNLLKTLAKKKSSNLNFILKENEINNVISKKNLDSKNSNLNESLNISFKNKNNFLTKFMLKLLNKNNKNIIESSKSNKNKEIFEKIELSPFNINSNNKKIYEKIDEENSITIDQKASKSQKLNLSNINKQKKSNENTKNNQPKNSNNNLIIFEYKNKKSIKNINNINSEKINDKSFINFKSNKKNNMKIENKKIENNENNHINKPKPIKLINNLNQNISIKNDGKKVLNNSSSKNKIDTINLIKPYQAENLLKINSNNNESNKKDEIPTNSNLTDESKITEKKDYNINKNINKLIDRKLENINKKRLNLKPIYNNLKLKNEDISEIISNKTSKKIEEEIPKNNSIINNKIQKIISRNENLQLNPYKTDNNINILENQEINIKSKNPLYDKKANTNKDLYEIPYNKQNIVKDTINSKKVENCNNISYRKSTSNLTISKKENKFKMQNRRRLTYFNPNLILKKRKSINYNIKEENDILPTNQKDKNILDEINKNESNDEKYNLFKNKITTNIEATEIKKDLDSETKKFIKKSEEPEDEETEVELIKLTIKKGTDLNSLINSFNNIEEDFIKNGLLNVSHNNKLKKEDKKNLLLYLLQYKRLLELKSSIKAEEAIQMEKELKQKYNDIIIDYIIKQKYKELIKHKDNNNKLRGDINKKLFKIVFEEIIENEGEITWILKLKEEKIIKNNKRKRTRIGYNYKEEKHKELIYDNSYLFKKNKKKKNIIIKQEVLDILQTEYSPGGTDKNDFTFNIKSRKHNFTISRNVNHYKKVKSNKKPIDIYKLSLFSDIKEEKNEKIETEEDLKDKLFEAKMTIFFNQIEKLKNSQKDFDYFSFLKNKEIDANLEKEDSIRLIGFTENINNLRNRERISRSKFNFLSPIGFQTKNYIKKI